MCSSSTVAFYILHVVQTKRETRTFSRLLIECVFAQAALCDSFSLIQLIGAISGELTAVVSAAALIGRSLCLREQQWLCWWHLEIRIAEKYKEKKGKKEVFFSWWKEWKLIFYTIEECYWCLWCCIYWKSFWKPDRSNPSNRHEGATRHNCGLFIGKRALTLLHWNTCSAKLLYFTSVRTPSGCMCDCSTWVYFYFNWAVHAPWWERQRSEVKIC